VEREIVPRGTIWKRAENACISLLFDGGEDGSAGKKHGGWTCFLRWNFIVDGDDGFLGLRAIFGCRTGALPVGGAS